MAINLDGGKGWLAIIVVLFVPGSVAAYFLDSPKWIVLWPVFVVVSLLILAALPIYRKTTPQEWAKELEKHLLGTDGAWGWDDATSARLKDERLEQVRCRLERFTLLDSEEKRAEFKEIIEALKRGEIPD